MEFNNKVSCLEEGMSREFVRTRKKRRKLYKKKKNIPFFGKKLKGESFELKMVARFNFCWFELEKEGWV